MTNETPSDPRQPGHRETSMLLRERFEQKFRRLADQWYEETGDSSTVGVKLAHPAYRHIIGLGGDVVPFILRELENEEGHWFLALSEITGEDPVPETADLDEAIEAWLDWGRRHGVL